MNNKNSKIYLEDLQDDFFDKKFTSKLVISFNRIAFIFFIFFFIFLIYSIHLIHLGSRKSNISEYYRVVLFKLIIDLVIFILFLTNF